MKLRLDIKKIRKIKKSMGLTFQEIADRAGLKSRQHAYLMLANGSLAAADIFAKAFKMKPKDLIL